MLIEKSNQADQEKHSLLEWLPPVALKFLVFAAFALTHVHQHTAAVDVTDLQARAFAQTQPTRIDGCQTHPVVKTAHGMQNLSNFLACQHVRQFLDFRRTDGV